MEVKRYFIGRIGGTRTHQVAVMSRNCALHLYVKWRKAGGPEPHTIFQVPAVFKTALHPVQFTFH